MENGWTKRIEELEAEVWRLQMMNPCGHTGFESVPCDICGYPDPRKLIEILTEERDRYKYDPVLQEIIAERDDLLNTNAKLMDENSRLSELLYGSRCVFCGEVIGKEKKNQDIADEVLRQHIKSCPKHPLTIARARIKELEHNLEVNGIDFSRKDGD